MTLTNWTDDSKSTITGKVQITDDSNRTENIMMDVTNELNQITVSENEFIHYRIIKSDSFKVEEVTPLEFKEQIAVMEENENGTSIESVEIIDEYGTVIKTRLTYYSTVDTTKVEISKEEYDSLNTEANRTSESPSISYSTYVQDTGWLDTVTNGQMSGTEGQSKRIESIKISINNIQDLGVKYSTHVQDYGWLDYVSDGQESGVIGETKRIEAIKIELSGGNAKNYDILYRANVQDKGWLGWMKNGELAGTTGESKRIESIEIKVAKKEIILSAQPKEPTILTYKSHIQDFGWLDSVSSGQLSGTVGQSKQVEAIQISLENAPYSGGISYRTHVQDYGWQGWVANGQVSGTTGKNKQVEAIQVSLSGEMKQYYDIEYRVHVQDYGWLSWVKNGELAGTTGKSKQVEAIEIRIIKKENLSPSLTYRSHVQDFGWLDSVSNGQLSGTVGQSKQLEAIQISLDNGPYSGGITYKTHVQDYGWLNNALNGQVSGTIGKGKQVEAIQVNLTGELAVQYDIYYRVHAQDYGWLGWAKNGMKAGSEGLSKQLEAIEMKLVPKGQGEAVTQNAAFKQKQLTVFLDPGHGGYDPGAISSGYHEANLNLSVSMKVEALLVKRGYKVYMSRNSDTFVSLLDRSIMANNVGTDIFISLHHNSTGAGTTSINGIESYYYKYKPEYPPKINMDMHDNPERILKSIALTDLIHGKIVNYTGATNRGIDGGAFSVIRESTMPSTLLELGFINNPSELQKLGTASYQNQLASAIADGIDMYFAIY